MTTIVIKLDPKANKVKVMDAIRLLKGVKSIAIADPPEFDKRMKGEEITPLNEPITSITKENSVDSGKNTIYKDVQKGIRDMKKGKVKPIDDLFR